MGRSKITLPRSRGFQGGGVLLKKEKGPNSIRFEKKRYAEAGTGHSGKVRQGEAAKLSHAVPALRGSAGKKGST